MFVFGIALFTAASMLGGLAQSETWLLAARAVQGVGAAIAAPSTLALLTVSFPEGSERTRAIALYSAVASAGASIGLVLGGMLTTWISWRWAFFINVPIGAVLVALAPAYLPETERHTGKFDLAGAASSTLGMSALVYGLVRMPMIDARRSSSPKAKVALVQQAVPPKERWQPERAPSIVVKLWSLTRAAEERGAELAIWPEAAYPYVLPHAAGRESGPFRVRGPNIRIDVVSGVLTEAPRPEGADPDELIVVLTAV